MASNAPVSASVTLLTIAFIIVVALSGTLSPLLLQRSARRVRALFLLGDAFAAGILASAALVHLLPAAHDSFRKYVPNVEYPLAGMFALFGACAVYILDHIVTGNTEKSAKSSSAMLGYVLGATLSFHAFVEGVALGASVIRRALFASIFAAILVHKFFAALSLGFSLARMVHVDSTARTHALLMAVMFALVTPVGAFFGMVIVAQVLSKNLAQVVTAALAAISAGVFLYIALVELLEDAHGTAYESTINSSETIPLVTDSADGTHHHHSHAPSARADYETHRHSHSRLNAAVFLLSASAMSMLAIWT